MNQKLQERAQMVLDDIKAERTIAAVATRGPWEPFYNEARKLHGVTATRVGHTGQDVAHCSMSGPHEEKADAAFIARARTIGPLALDCLEDAINALLGEINAHYVAIEENAALNRMIGLSGMPTPANGWAPTHCESALARLCDRWEAGK